MDHTAFLREYVTRSEEYVQRQLITAEEKKAALETVCGKHSLKEAIEAAFAIEDRAFGKSILEDMLAHFLPLYGIFRDPSPANGVDSLIIHLAPMKTSFSSAESIPFFLAIQFTENGTLEKVVAKPTYFSKSISSQYTKPEEPEMLTFLSEYVRLLNTKSSLLAKARCRTASNTKWSDTHRLLYYLCECIPNDRKLHRNKGFFENALREQKGNYKKECDDSLHRWEERQRLVKEKLEEMREFADGLGVHFEVKDT